MSADSAAQRALTRFGLVNKTALVTGGTQGIGKAVVEELAELGASIFTCSRREDKLKEALTEWHSRGLKVEGCIADISDATARAELVQKATDHFQGSLNILVNNVGTNKRKPTVDYTAEEYSFLMSTNLESAYNMCQLCHGLLKASRDAVVLFNSSVAGGPSAMKSGTIYGMTKGGWRVMLDGVTAMLGPGGPIRMDIQQHYQLSSAVGTAACRLNGANQCRACWEAAMNQLTKNLACEWAADSIRVNSVAPWYTATPLALQVLQDKTYEQEVLDRTPMKRIAQPEEVSGLMAYLCSPAASYITGQVIQVDGGYSVMGYY